MKVLKNLPEKFQDYFKYNPEKHKTPAQFESFLNRDGVKEWSFLTGFIQVKLSGEKVSIDEFKERFPLSEFNYTFNKNFYELITELDTISTKTLKELTSIEGNKFLEWLQRDVLQRATDHFEFNADKVKEVLSADYHDHVLGDKTKEWKYFSKLIKALHENNLDDFLKKEPVKLFDYTFDRKNFYYIIKDIASTKKYRFPDLKKANHHFYNYITRSFYTLPSDIRKIIYKMAGAHKNPTMFHSLQQASSQVKKDLPTIRFSHFDTLDIASSNTAVVWRMKGNIIHCLEVSTQKDFEKTLAWHLKEERVSSYKVDLEALPEIKQAVLCSTTKHKAEFDLLLLFNSGQVTRLPFIRNLKDSLEKTNSFDTTTIYELPNIASFSTDNHLSAFLTMDHKTVFISESKGSKKFLTCTPPEEMKINNVFIANKQIYALSDTNELFQYDKKLKKFDFSNPLFNNISQAVSCRHHIAILYKKEEHFKIELLGKSIKKSSHPLECDAIMKIISEDDITSGKIKLMGSGGNIFLKHDDKWYGIGFEDSLRLNFISWDMVADKPSLGTAFPEKAPSSIKYASSSTSLGIMCYSHQGEFFRIEARDANKKSFVSSFESSIEYLKRVTPYYGKLITRKLLPPITHKVPVDTAIEKDSDTESSITP